MYNTDTFKTPPKSWNVVFEEQELPDGKSNKGRIQAYDGAIYIADAALYLMAKKPELGIKDPYELNEDQYKAALDLLRQEHKLIQRYWHDAKVQVDDFKNEGVVGVMLVAVSGQSLAIRQAPGSFHRSRRRGDGLGRHHDDGAGAKHPNCAYIWLEHSHSAEGPRRRRGLVRLGACGARRLQGQRAPDRRRMQDQRLRQFRAGSSSGGPRTPSARPKASCVPYSQWAKDYIASIEDLTASSHPA